MPHSRRLGSNGSSCCVCFVFTGPARPHSPSCSSGKAHLLPSFLNPHEESMSHTITAPSVRLSLPLRLSLPHTRIPPLVFSGLLTAGLRSLSTALIRFYTPTSGRISLDGVWMGALDKRFLTNQIALVGQVSGHEESRGAASTEWSRPTNRENGQACPPYLCLPDLLSSPNGPFCVRRAPTSSRAACGTTSPTAPTRKHAAARTSRYTHC